MMFAEEMVMTARHNDKCLCTACVCMMAGKQDEVKGHFADFLASNLR